MASPDDTPSLRDAPTAEVELARVAGRIASPAAEIWALLMDFARPQRLAPTIEHCDCLGVGEGAVRRVQARGLAIYEQLIEADRAAWVFRYAVLPEGDMPLAALESYIAEVRLKPITASATQIEWSSRGIVTAPLAPITSALTALYTRAIDNIARRPAQSPT